MTHPFGIYYDKAIDHNVGIQEHEILLPRRNIFEVIDHYSTSNCFFISLLLRHQMIPQHHMISTESKDVPEQFFNKSEYKKMDRSTYIDLKTKISDFEKDNQMTNIYKGYMMINTDIKRIDYDNQFYRKIYDIASIDLISWLDGKPKYDILKYASIPEKEFDETYKKFIDLIPLMKRSRNLYINVSIIYKQSNELYNEIYRNIQMNRINRVIRIKKPLIVEKSISYSVFSDAVNFMTNGMDRNMLATNRIDIDYPMMILIRYKNRIRYIPLNSDYGFVFEIKRLKINKVEKKHITNNVYYYLVSAS